MKSITRRVLLGTAATGSVTLAACATTASTPHTAPVEGTVSFLHGVASGDPLSDRIILWTRVTPAETQTQPITVAWQVTEVSNPDTVIASGEVKTSATRDWTVKVDAAGLTPGTHYTYRFSVLTSEGTVTSREGRMRTPAIAGNAPVNLGVVSCSNWQFGYFNAYRALSEEPDLDAIVHLGDYLYEYGLDGYGGEVAKKIGRIHEPDTEIVSLSDYRARHSQYKTDPDLQAAHAAAAWICTWDDHESANDSYRTGAENHDPDKGEGDWSARKQTALQAYFEWMPIREPEAGNITSAVYRSFRFGDVATLHALETRLTGRSKSIGWFDILGDATTPEEYAQKAQAGLIEINDPARTMMGTKQEEWLAKDLKASVDSGAAWQILGNQVVMARTKLPDLTTTLSDAQKAKQENGFVQQMIAFSALGLPMNLDAWDGYPAARDRLYAGAKAAGARLVTLTGDTHTAWGNTLVDKDGERRGIELGCTSISSPGSGEYVVDVPDLGPQIANVNPEVNYHDPFGHGYTRVVLTDKTATADFVKVSSILDKHYETTRTTLASEISPDSMSELRRI